MKITLHAHPTMPGLFLTRDGRVFRQLPVSPSDHGYHTVKIGRETVRRHTLVAETFIGPRPPGQEARHRDGNPANDLPTNLEWGTHTENGADMMRHGRSTRGDRNAMVKLAEAEARAIRRRRKAGESGKSLAEEFNISQQTVCDILAGRTWRWL